jgi:hypothetical protein
LTFNAEVNASDPGGTYQWYINNHSTGSGSDSIRQQGLLGGDRIKVIYLPANKCIAKAESIPLVMQAGNACTEVQNLVYYVLSGDHSPAVAISDKINFFYREDYQSGMLHAKIYNFNKQINIDVSLLKNYGENYLELDVTSLGLVKNNIYTLEIKEEKGDRKYLAFKYE